MMDEISHDVLVLGSGLAGLRAALEIARRLGNQVSIGLVSKVQLMRAHSVAAQGGTAAVLRAEEGDTLELHAWDTVKGSDFLADQDVVFKFVERAPQEIYQLEHWGLPWSRREDGRILQRAFGGHSLPRATMAADMTGFYQMQTLYDTLHTIGNLTRYDEVFATAIIVDDKRFRGLTVLNLKNGQFLVLRAKALLIASGGAGTLYGFTTYSQTVTGDGHAMAYRAGLALEDMEFIQFHPTGLVPSGILMTEGCRGEGGYLLNNKDERFMEHYAPQKMELAPRDIICRAMMTEIYGERGFKQEHGMSYLHLDLTHLGAEKINSRLPLIREVCMKFLGIDPIVAPIPVSPVAHYSMGGIETDINGATQVQGVWAAGEAACVSLHGANRLGTNSTAECLVWGGISGAEIAEYLRSDVPLQEISADRVRAEEQRIFGQLLQQRGNENPYRIREELRHLMDECMGVYRTHETMKKGLDAVRELKARFHEIAISDQSRIYNTNLINVLELENLLDLAEVTILSGLARKESRGAHARTDFPKRDDQHWLKHTLVTNTPEGPHLDYKPVAITNWEPVERKY